MKKSQLVSIIIPVYNAEKYLYECLQSVVLQTYINLQIIIIDDGSKDKSNKIYEDFADKDTRIEIIKQQNKGVSSARNKGIERAKGDWILFVDADDTLTFDAIDVLLKYDNACSYDLIVGSLATKNRKEVNNEITTKIFRKKENEKEFLGLTILRPTNPVNQDLFPKKMWDGPILTGPWLKLYKNSIIKDNSISFDTNMRIGEDCFFNTQYIQKADTILFVDYEMYYYRYVETSAYNNIEAKINFWNPYYEKMLPIAEKFGLLEHYYRKIFSVLHEIISAFAQSYKKRNMTITEIIGATKKYAIMNII